MGSWGVFEVNNILNSFTKFENPSVHMMYGKNQLLCIYIPKGMPLILSRGGGFFISCTN